jgi:hypothetical protein
MTSVRQPPGLVPLREAVAELLDLSDERGRWLRRELAAERRGYDRGHRDGFCGGYERAAADLEASWHEFARPISRGDFGDQDVARRVRIAERGCEADARQWWAEFLRRASDRPPRQRSDPQTGAVWLAGRARHLNVVRDGGRP